MEQCLHTPVERVCLHLAVVVERVQFLHLAQLLIGDDIKRCIIQWFRGFACDCATGDEKKQTILAGCLENNPVKDDWTSPLPLQKH